MRMGTPYGELYREVLDTNAELTPSSGGYFVAPKGELDDRLFEGDRLRQDIRGHLLNMLYGFWNQRYADPQSWSTAWIAGSQITPQWREEGDLDILIGINMARFLKANPNFRGFPEKIVASHLNNEMREELWVDDWMGAFEVTFYVNPKTGDDIRNINPYAAYNLSADEWTVLPPDLPEDWSEQSIPQPWRTSVESEIEQARQIVDRFEEARRSLAGVPNQSPGWTNAMHQMRLITEQAASLFESIHGERKRAFQGLAGVEGQGFHDYYNYRWQAHKKAGTVKALSAIRGAARAADNSLREERYGTSQILTDILPDTLGRGY